jgi:small subunit ribosomal protein S5
VHAAKLGLVDEKSIKGFSKKHFPEYTPQEKEILRKTFTPAQMAALEAGEKAIDPDDLTIQGRLRTDSGTMPYLDDYAKIEPIFDFPVRDKPMHKPAQPKFLTMDEYIDDLSNMAAELDVNTSQEEKDLEKQLFGTEGVEEGLREEMGERAGETAAKERKLSELSDEEFQKVKRQILDEDKLLWEEIAGRGALSHGIGQGTGNTRESVPLGDIPGVTEFYQDQAVREEEAEDPTGEYRALRIKTGLNVAELKDLTLRDKKNLVRRNVHNQTRLGKIRRSSLMYLVGNGRGRIGIGMGKSEDVQVAQELAIKDAISKLTPITRYEERTIYGNVEAKVGGTVVQLFSRPPGAFPPIYRLGCLHVH